MENELIIIEEGKALEFFTEGGLEPFLAEIEKRVDTFEHDMTTKKGRDATRAFARKIASFKQRVEEKGVDLVSPLKKQTKAIDEGRKHSKDTLDALRDKARQPLTDWENTEEARKAAHVANLETLKELVINEAEDSATYAANLATAKATPMGECWEEYAAGAAANKDEVVAFLEGALEKALKLEAEKAELEKLRVAEEERKQKERDDLIRKEAGDKARREEAEKLDEAKRLKEVAERELIEGAKRAEIEKKEAVETAKREEAAKIQRETDAKATEEAEREKNKLHVGHIRKEAKISLMAIGYDEDDAVKIVKAIAAGQIANVSIQY